jgi:thioredoxin 1
MTIEIYDNNFSQEVTSSDKPVLIDFYADWCAPCRNFLPAVEAASKELSGEVKVIKINIDENPKITSQLGVRSIPALFLFNNGEQIASSNGSRSKTQLVDWVKESLN